MTFIKSFHDFSPHGLEYSPIALYQFNGDGTDSSGNGLHLSTVSGTPYYGTIVGIPMVSLENGHLKRPSHDSLLTITREISVEAIIIPMYSSNSPRFIATFSGNSDVEADNLIWDLRVHTTGALATVTEHGAGVDDVNVFSYTPAPVSLIHVAYTRDATGLQNKLYINGVQSGSTVVSANASTGGTAGVLAVGAFVSDVATTRFQGWIGSLKIVASELTASQIKSEYNLTLGPLLGRI